MSSARILVVEDEWLVSQGIKETLQDLGYEVAGPVASGEEALELAQTMRPDLVLMDILLKGVMDGIETAECLRRLRPAGDFSYRLCRLPDPGKGQDHRALRLSPQAF